VYLIASHDESCFKAGQFCTRGWVEGKRQTCMDKSEGPSHHYACFAVEWGNGCICLDPEAPPPLPISISELRTWHDKWKLGIPVALPQTADVSMDPGAPPKQGWWKSDEFWMQIDLACEIFKTVWGPPETSRFRLVAHLDWSQGHACMDPSALNAEKMLVGVGKTATHLRCTSYPYKVNGHNMSIPRALLCEPNCSQCMADCEKYASVDSPHFDPNFQSIGKKGLKVVLDERGLLMSGWHHPEMLKALQKCADFKPQDLIGRAAVTQQMRDHGYIALFGVKYHAELAHIERKWMMLKRMVRSRLDGGLPRLKRLLADAWPNYGVADARKAARHCRETMRAYMKLGGDDLDKLREEELKMKGHRRVFDGTVGRFILKAELKQSAMQKFFALRTECSRLHKLAKHEYNVRCEAAWTSRVKRIARDEVDEDTKDQRKLESKKRTAQGILKSKEAGDAVSDKRVKWAENTMNED
jgi:hypothetical protein